MRLVRGGSVAVPLHVFSKPGRHDGADARLARRGRKAAFGVVVVLLGVSLFAVASSDTTARAASVAATATRLSDAYGRAADAVSTEESLERKYRLEPGPNVRARFDAAGAGLVAALRDVRAIGGTADAARVADVLTEHTAYRTAIARMFAAVDAHNRAEVLRIDATEGDPAFSTMETKVDTAAAGHRVVAFQQLDHLQRLERRFRVLTPIVFGLGLVLAALLAATSRGYRQALLAERAEALRASSHDALTGLPNRALLATRVDEQLQDDRGTGRTSALLLVDLDRFREVNDTFGHEYGDQLLEQVGPRLLRAVRPQDTVARLGGDEFAVLLAGLTEQDIATEMAWNISRTLEAPFQVHGIELDVEASVGVALSGVHGRDAQTLLKRADIAMYTAKAQNLRVAAYQPTGDHHSPAKLALIGELRGALQRQELVLYYQPKIHVGTGALVGVEALLRWQHPTRGLVTPDDFIPAAERTGLIGPMTRYVLDAALRQVNRWSAAGQHVRVAVNLSARNLLDESLADDIASSITQHDVPAGLLELEITESAVITEPDRARRSLQRLVDLGVTIAVDDFGAGFTSLGQLRLLPVDAIKIDRSFVMAMAAQPADARLVRTIIDLGHDLGLTVVAEGVDSGHTLDLLRALHCDHAQGYYIARPLPRDAFDRWLQSRPMAGASRPS